MADLKLTEKEKKILAYTLLGEAAGEGKDGMSAVMSVILNRANSGRYSSNPAVVATQANSKGIHQFSTWNTKGAGGNSPKTTFDLDSAQYRQAMDIVQAAMAGKLEDKTGGATHFVTKKLYDEARPGWWDAEAPAGSVEIGNHVFGAKSAATALAAINQVTGQKAPVPLTKPLAFADTNVSGGKSTTSELAPPRPVSTIRMGTDNQPLATLTGSSQRLPQGGTQTPTAKASLSHPANSADLVGQAARSVAATGNAASASKTSRGGATKADLVGTAATKSTVNAASATKTSRSGAAPAPAYAAVQGQNKSIQQIGQEIDNATLSGYRDIQSMGPSSRGAPPKPVTKFATPGVVKTANGITGTVQLPRSVTPQVNIRPPSVSDSTKPRSVALPAEPKRLPNNDALRLSYQVPSSQLQLAIGNTSTAVPSGGSRRGRAKPADIANAKTAIGPKLNEPILPEGLNAAQASVIAGRNAKKVAAPKPLLKPEFAQQPVAPVIPPRPVYDPNNPANFSVASSIAAAAGQNSYTLSTGGLMPLYAPSGNKRNTYADEYNFGSGGLSSGSTNPSWW